MEAVIAVTPSETIKCVHPNIGVFICSCICECDGVVTDMNRTKMIEDSKRPNPHYKGFAHGVRTIVAEEGYRGLYRGVGPVVSLHPKPPCSGPRRIIYPRFPRKNLPCVLRKKL